MKIAHLLIAVLLDWIIGDPYFFPHPVKLMGTFIEKESTFFLHRSKDPRKVRLYGALTVIINGTLAFFLPFFLLKVLPGIWRDIFTVYSIYACISARMLHYEGMMVKKALGKGLEAARNRLRYIVGRDTAELSREEIIAATVETVAENTSDGVIAPMFYLFLLGVPGGYLYKMINTMDSMVGYKNDKYLHYGKWPATVDDWFNFIPARITAFLMATWGIFLWKNPLPILLRDCRNHTSPNAGYPEAAVAALLGIRLGGGHFYFGKFVEKPTIGEEEKAIEEKDISGAIKIMYWTEILMTLIFVLLN